MCVAVMHAWSLMTVSRARHKRGGRRMKVAWHPLIRVFLGCTGLAGIQKRCNEAHHGPSLLDVCDLIFLARLK